MYKLTYKKSALKALQKMPKTKALKMHQELTNIAQAPYTYEGDWKPMKGQPFWRLRQGSYRAICRGALQRSSCWHLLKMRRMLQTPALHCRSLPSSRMKPLREILPNA